MIALIDNYDSFTFNVYDYLMKFADIRVFRNTDSLEDLTVLDLQGLVIPPGPSHPSGSLLSHDAISHFKGKIPILGICLGMQMAVIEAARNLAGVKDAGSEEFDHEAGQKRFTPVVYHLKEWVQGNHIVARKVGDDKGGTMRLGAYSASLAQGSKVAQIYGATNIEERHRHRYEVDTKYREKLEACGLVFSGMSPDGKLPEIVEVKDHPWFIGVQFHPELKSKPFAPHPLFADFVRAAIEMSRLV